MNITRRDFLKAAVAAAVLSAGGLFVWKSRLFRRR